MMRSILISLFALTALPLSAAIRFVPPDPTTRTPVTAYVTGGGCGTSFSGSAVREGAAISIDIRQEFCGFPMLVGFDVPVDLGILPAGLYDVDARFQGASLGETQLPVRDAAQPFGIKPNVYDIRGGAVRIHGENVAGCGGPPPTICAPTVKFGDVEATNVRPASTGEIVVDAPPHAPGVVDVTVAVGNRVLRAPAAFHYFGSEPNAAFFERVLVPVFFSGPGAFGSEWRTEAAIYNGDDYPISEAGTALFGRPAANAVTFASGESVSTGVVTFLPRYVMGNVHFSLLVRDVSRSASAFGTSVPVVREKDWFDRPFSIVNVPSDPKNRVALRIYGNWYEVRMNIVALRTNQVLVYAIEYSQPARGHRFAFIGDLLTKYPEIAGQGPLRLELLSATPADPLWAYVSITNNDTQHVTVIAPE